MYPFKNCHFEWNYYREKRVVLVIGVKCKARANYVMTRPQGTSKRTQHAESQPTARIPNNMNMKDRREEGLLF